MKMCCHKVQRRLVVLIPTLVSSSVLCLLTLLTCFSVSTSAQSGIQEKGPIAASANDDLLVSKHVIPENVPVDSNITFTIRITATANLTNVVVRDSLEQILQQTEFVTATIQSAQGIPYPQPELDKISPSDIIWPPLDTTLTTTIQANDSITISIVTSIRPTITAGTVITNQALIVTDLVEPQKVIRTNVVTATVMEKPSIRTEIFLPIIRAPIIPYPRLTSGGFEGDNDFWKQLVDEVETDILIVDRATLHDAGFSVDIYGDKAAWLGGSNETIHVLSQVVPVPDVWRSDPMFVAFMLWVGSDEPNCDDESDQLAVSMDGIDVDIRSLCRNSSTSMRQIRPATPVDPGEEVEIKFTVKTNGDRTSNALIDNVVFCTDKLEANTPCPEAE